MSLPKVCIIGTGNLALHLSRHMEKAGFTVNEVYGRSLSKAKALTSQLYAAKAVDELDFSESEASLFFLCVSDAAIEELAKELLLPEGTLLVHCSGATSMQVMEREDVDYGVFYPIQTFSPKRKVTFQDIAVCLEASTDEAETMLEMVAKKMGAKPYFMSSSQRLTLHLSAVFACNFSNHFYRIAQELLQEQGLPFDLLRHLVQETVVKAFEVGPENAQTGPAVREDRSTMTEHEVLLKSHPVWRELYRKISEDIMKAK